MTTKLVILTQIMAPYRIPVFNRLADDPELDVIVLFAAEREPHRLWPTYEAEMSFEYEVLPEHFTFRQSTSWTHLSRGLGRRLRRSRADVVVAGGWDQITHLWAYVLRRPLGYRFVWWVESTERDVRPASLWREKLKRWVVSHADAVLVPGVASQRYVHSLGAGDIVVAPNAVDNERFMSGSGRTRSEEFEFIFVGRLQDEKGIPDLLQAWSMVRSRTVRLRIVGDGPLRDQVVTYARKDERVQVSGHMNREELVSAYHSADALVLPSRSEPWGLVINEAMASGLPVIASSVAGAVDDLVREGHNGLIVPPNNPRALAAALSELAGDPDRALEMGSRSLEMIRKYSPEACARGFRELASKLNRK